MKNIELRHSGDKTYIRLNFLGGMETFARREDSADIDLAISEAVVCFVHAAGTHGLGMLEEMKMLDRASGSGE